MNESFNNSTQQQASNTQMRALYPEPGLTADTARGRGEKHLVAVGGDGLMSAHVPESAGARLA